jgi:hypothetical protein
LTQRCQLSKNLIQFICKVIDYPKLPSVRRLSYEQDNLKASI